jgi:hypothetical protein
MEQCFPEFRIHRAVEIVPRRFLGTAPACVNVSDSVPTIKFKKMGGK